MSPYIGWRLSPQERLSDIRPRRGEGLPSSEVVEHRGGSGNGSGSPVLSHADLLYALEAERATAEYRDALDTLIAQAAASDRNSEYSMPDDDTGQRRRRRTRRRRDSAAVSLFAGGRGDDDAAARDRAETERLDTEALAALQLQREPPAGEHQMDAVSMLLLRELQRDSEGVTSQREEDVFLDEFFHC